MLRSESDDSTDSRPDHEAEARSSRIDFFCRDVKWPVLHPKRPALSTSPPFKKHRRPSRTRDAPSSQEYLSAHSTTGEWSPETGSPPLLETSPSTPSRLTETPPTNTPKFGYSLSPGASLVAQGPSRDLQQVALSLTEFSDSTSPRTFYQEQTPRSRPIGAPLRQRVQRSSFPADIVPSHQLSFFQGRDRSQMRVPFGLSGERRADSRSDPNSNLPQLLKIGKSISEGNLLYVRPEKRKRRRKTRDFLPLALSREDPMVRTRTTGPLAALKKVPEPTTTDDTSPTSFVVECHDIVAVKLAEGEVSPARNFDIAPRSPTASRAPSLTSDANTRLVEADDGPINEKPTPETSLLRRPLPTERSKKTSDAVPIPQPRRISMATSGGDRTAQNDTCMTSASRTPPESKNETSFFGHWKKVFDARSLKTAADDPSSKEEVTASMSQSIGTSVAVFKDVFPHVISGSETERAPEAIKEKHMVISIVPSHTVGTDLLTENFEGDYRTNKRGTVKERNSSRRSFNIRHLDADRLVKQTTAVNNRLHERKRLTATFIEDVIGGSSAATELESENKKKDGHVEFGDAEGSFLSGQARRRSTYTGMHDFDISRIIAKEEKTTVKNRNIPIFPDPDRKPQTEEVRSGWEMAGASHPSPRSVVHTYLKSHHEHWSSNSERRGRDSLSSGMTTKGKDYYKGYLHAGKVLPSSTLTMPPKHEKLVTALPKVDERFESRNVAHGGELIEKVPVEWEVAPQIEQPGMVDKGVDNQNMLEKDNGFDQLASVQSLGKPVEPPRTSLDMPTKGGVPDGLKQDHENIIAIVERKTPPESEEEEEQTALHVEYPPEGTPYGRTPSPPASLKEAPVSTVTKSKDEEKALEDEKWPAGAVSSTAGAAVPESRTVLQSEQVSGESTVGPAATPGMSSSKKQSNLSLQKTAILSKSHKTPEEPSKPFEKDKKQKSELKSAASASKVTSALGKAANFFKSKFQAEKSKSGDGFKVVPPTTKIELESEMQKPESVKELALRDVEVVGAENVRADWVGENEKAISEKDVRPFNEQALVLISDAEMQEKEAISLPIHESEMQGPPSPSPKPPIPLHTKHGVSVKVSFVKPKGNEAYYIAMIKIRTIPLLVLLGNIVVLIILLIGSYFDLFWWFYIEPAVLTESPSNKKGLGLVCRSIRCGLAGSTLYYALNHSVEPCDSMFEFVCKRWIHEPSARYQKVILGAEKHFMEETYKEMRDIVQSPHIFSRGSTAFKKVAKLYKGCQNKNNADFQHLRKLKQDYGLDGWPFFMNFSGDAEDVLAKFIRDTGSGTLISVRIIPDPESSIQPSHKLIALECSTFRIPIDTLLTYRESQKEIIKAYKNLISHTAEDFRNAGREKMVNQTFNFEVNLANRCNKECRKMPLKKIKVRDLSDLGTQSSKMNWDKFLGIVLSHTAHSISPETEILVRSVSYLKKIGELLHNRTTKVRLMNYVGWRFMAKFARHASARFEQHFENFQTTAIGQEELPNWKRCLLDTAEVMPFAVGRLYAELKQWEATDFKVHELVLNLISSLDHMLQEFNWVQGVTKQKAKTILSSANIAVGYPEWILDNKALDQYYEEIPANGVYLSLYEHALRNRFIHQLNISNSYSRIPTKMAHFIFPTKMVELHQRSGHLRETLFYDIRENTFVIPSGVFSAPYYNPDLTWAMNYGGLGTLVARDVISEFFHAADARWMTETDRHVYRNGSQCVLRAIGKRSQRIPEEALLHCSSLVRSLLSLRLTYNAYHLHLGVQDEATLPGLEDMSPDQVFFVAAFRTLCTQIRELHFVPVVHLNGTVTELDYLDGLMRGMNEFTDAFSCNKLRDMPNVVQQCLAPSSPAAKLRARKRTLWHPPAMHFTTPDNPVLTTERRTTYRRNRTVFKRPYHHIQP